LEPDGFFCIRSGQLQNLSVRSGRNPAGSFLTSIRQKSGKKSGKKIEKSPVKSVRFIFDVKLTKIRQKTHKKSGKKIEKNPAKIRFRPAG
jgi:hypothetical protein